MPDSHQDHPAQPNNDFASAVFPNLTDHNPFAAGPILLVTATPIETAALHERMTPRDGSNSIEQVSSKSYTYFCGKFGKANAIHVQCAMGSVGPGSSILTVVNAVQTWKPSAIIMVGIAFGVNDREQKIADILVSRQIIPYDPKKVGTDRNQARGIPLMAGQRLIAKFTNAHTWQQDFGTGGNCAVIHGDMLSGEELIDNREHRDNLVREFGPVVGGEMEGCGLMVAARDGEVSEWIVVKGICDFADGNKAHEKVERQKKAAKAAVSLCEHVLEQNPCFHTNTVITNRPFTQPIGSINDIFFVSYRPAIEPYFLGRVFDERVSTALKHGNLWLWGKSGVGKTVSLQRTASQLGLECVFVDLSSAVNANVCTILENAFWRLAEFFEPDLQSSPIGTQKDSDYWVRSIVSLIGRKMRKDTVIIFDEFSLRSHGDFEPFLEYAFTIIFLLTNQALAHRLHLAFASGARPLSPGTPLFRKLQERFTILEMEEWTKDEIHTLTKVISSHTNTQFNFEELDSLGIKNPRTLKTLLRLHLFDLTKQSDLSLLETAQKHHDELS